jgi:hypothetical protein
MLDRAAHRVQLLILDHHRDGFRALDLDVEERRALEQDVADLPFLHLEGDCVLAAGVDDPGDDAVAAHASRGARAELGARSDLQSGAGSCHRTGKDRETGRKAAAVAT